jgi:hypothetical protein
MGIHDMVIKAVLSVMELKGGGKIKRKARDCIEIRRL